MSSVQRLEARDRVTLLMAFVPYLIENSPVSLDTLADHFSITRAQAGDLISLLALSGIPGETGQYQHQDLFDINWDLFEESQIVELWSHVGIDSHPRFSAREAAVLVAGLQYISAVVPGSDKPVITALLEKISAGSSTTPENLTVTPAPVTEEISLILQAISERRSISFNYKKSNEQSQYRVVDPLRIDAVGSSWYLRAWCHTRNAVRTFRLDRMSTVSFSQVPFMTTLGSNEVSDDLFTANVNDLVVEFSVAQEVLPLIKAYSPTVLRELSPDFLEISVQFAHLDAVPTFITQVPGAITVLGPHEAVESVRNWARQALNSYTA